MIRTYLQELSDLSELDPPEAGPLRIINRGDVPLVRAPCCKRPVLADSLISSPGLDSEWTCGVCLKEAVFTGRHTQEAVDTAIGME